MLEPSCGDIWIVDLSAGSGDDCPPVRCPCLIVSVDAFNKGAAGMVVLAPLTRKGRGIPFNVKLMPPEGGLEHPGYVKCHALRSCAKERLLQLWGSVSAESLEAVKDRIRILLDL